MFRERQVLALTVGGSVHDDVFLLSLAGSTKQLAKQLPKFERLNLLSVGLRNSQRGYTLACTISRNAGTQFSCGYTSIICIHTNSE